MASVAETNTCLFSSLGNMPPESVIFGCSAAMDAVRRKVQRVAGANVPVLMQGESGTGKEVVAKLIHNLSPWKDGPFVKVNCPAIPGTLLESELFGYEKGAFTGAYGSKPGRVELANRGMLFLDEISELDPSLQAKLLQLLQDGEFCRIGAQENRRVEVRVISATNRDIDQEIQAGTFRQDLFYRISVLTVNLPPLRERLEDIPGLVNYFLEFYNRAYNDHAPPLSAPAMEILQQHDWPGNIRELENLIKRFVILGSEEAFTTDLVGRPRNHFSFKIEPGDSVPLKEMTRQAVLDLERKTILQVLQAHHWNRKQTARVLKISYRALLYKIRQAGLPSSRGASSTLRGAADSASSPNRRNGLPQRQERGSNALGRLVSGTATL